MTLRGGEKNSFLVVVSAAEAGVPCVVNGPSACRVGLEDRLNGVIVEALFLFLLLVVVFDRSSRAVNDFSFGRSTSNSQVFRSFVSATRSIQFVDTTDGRVRVSPFQHRSI